MREVMTIHVLGLPQPKGSKKGYNRGGHVVLVDDNAATLKPWQYEVKRAAYDVRKAFGILPIVGPVALRIVFVFPRTSDARKRDFWKVKKPDGDKLERAVWDALTEAGVFFDDAQVCDWACRKRMALPGNLDDIPGCYITVGIPDNPLDPPEPEQVLTPLPLTGVESTAPSTEE